MQDFSKNDNTVVIVYPRDHNKTFEYIEDMADNMRAEGTDVVVIGVGTINLSLEEIQRELENVEGPASLYIAAHGDENGTIWGITKEREGSDAFWVEQRFGSPDAVLGRDFFQIVPENFNTIISGSCYGEMHVEDAVKYLPEGTLFFPEWADDELGYSYDLKRSFFEENSGAFVNGTQGVTASEFFFHIATAVHDPRVTAEAMRRQGRDPSEFNETMTRNFPETIGIGGIGVVNMRRELENLDSAEVSDKDIREFLTEYDKLVEQPVGYIDGFGQEQTFQLGVDPNTGEYSEEYAIAQMRILIETGVEGGIMEPHQPYYVLMHAFAFDQSEAGKALGQTNDYIVANRPQNTETPEVDEAADREGSDVTRDTASAWNEDIANNHYRAATTLETDLTSTFSAAYTADPEIIAAVYQRAENSPEAEQLRETLNNDDTFKGMENSIGKLTV